MIELYFATIKPHYTLPSIIFDKILVFYGNDDFLVWSVLYRATHVLEDSL